MPFWQYVRQRCRLHCCYISSRFAIKWNRVRGWVGGGNSMSGHGSAIVSSLELGFPYCGASPPPSPLPPRETEVSSLLLSDPTWNTPVTQFHLLDNLSFFHQECVPVKRPVYKWDPKSVCLVARARTNCGEVKGSVWKFLSAIMGSCPQILEALDSFTRLIPISEEWGWTFSKLNSIAKFA